jgi:hypothetical protein
MVYYLTRFCNAHVHIKLQERVNFLHMKHIMVKAVQKKRLKKKIINQAG